jgi:hypothetical protein
MRTQVGELGLSALDERITSNMRGSDGPFWDLLFYLKHLREEIQLGSDAQYRETLRRVRQHVQTESGVPVEGIRVEFSPEEVERYGVRELVLAPSRELGGIADEFGALIEALRNDYERNSETGGTE